jgi:hypothetical protein
MAKRLQHDMNTDPNYVGWFAGMIAVLVMAGLVCWSLSGDSNVASNHSSPSSTVGSAPSGAMKAPANPPPSEPAK